MAVCISKDSSTVRSVLFISSQRDPGAFAMVRFYDSGIRSPRVHVAQSVTRSCTTRAGMDCHCSAGNVLSLGVFGP
jgi:hypothetical protein